MCLLLLVSYLRSLSAGREHCALDGRRRALHLGQRSANRYGHSAPALTRRAIERPPFEPPPNSLSALARMGVRSPPSLSAAADSALRSLIYASLATSSHYSTSIAPLTGAGAESSTGQGSRVAFSRRPDPGRPASTERAQAARCAAPRQPRRPLRSLGPLDDDACLLRARAGIRLEWTLTVSAVDW